MKIRHFIFILLTIFCIFSFSCSKNKLKNLNMDQISSMAYNERWAVITAPYTTFYENPEISNNSTKHGRKGDILKVEGKRIKPLGKNESEIWYKLEEGWVEEKNIYICRNQFQAREYSSKLISSSN